MYNIMIKKVKFILMLFFYILFITKRVYSFPQEEAETWKKKWKLSLSDVSDVFGVIEMSLI